MKISTDKEVKIYQEGYDAGIYDANRQCINKLKRLIGSVYNRAIDTDSIEDLDEMKRIIRDFQEYQKNRK